MNSFLNFGESFFAGPRAKEAQNAAASTATAPVEKRVELEGFHDDLILVDGVPDHLEPHKHYQCGDEFGHVKQTVIGEDGIATVQEENRAARGGW